MTSVPHDHQKPAPHDDEPVLVTMRFVASDPDTLLSVLSRYAVLSRGAHGCRNIDLVASSAAPGRYLVIEKWTSATDQRTHLDSDVMVTMAQSCDGILAEPPEIELFDGVSMHDLA